MMSEILFKNLSLFLLNFGAQFGFSFWVQLLSLFPVFLVNQEESPALVLQDSITGEYVQQVGAK